MGRYAIRFSCGHEDTIELFGKRTDIDHKISCLERNGLCPACCRESREMAMTDFERMHGFPILTGSEKQIIWGRNIRKDGFEQMDEWLRNMEEGLHGEENELLSYAKDFVEKFFHTETKAAVYIEMEQYGFSRMLRKTIGKQYKKEHP